jgi:cyclophilin family peptidyl-prolyl cis-trans isomerase
LALPAAARAQDRPRLSDERVVMQTDSGDVVFAFYPDVAPEHVKQILNLVRLGCYDHSVFVRVEPGFVIQLGDVLQYRHTRNPPTEEQIKAIRPIKAEFSALHHRRGILSMARADGQPDSATTSFSIVLGNDSAGHLDGQYTVFGEVVYGMDVMDRLCQVPPLFIEPRSPPMPMIPLDVYKMQVVTAKDLDLSKLTPAHDVAIPPDIVAQAHQQAWAAHRKALESSSGTTILGDRQGVYLLTGGLLMVIVLSLATFVGAGRLSQRWVISLNMLSVLIGGFLLLVVLTPVAHSDSNRLMGQVLGVAVFVSFFGIFKLLSRFESVG